MSAEPVKMYSQEEYLEMERAAEYKSEYYRGEIFAMSGASRAHNRINENLSIEIGSFLKGKSCESFSRDLRVHIPENTLYTYPDLIISCKNPIFQDHYDDTLLNPTAILEILSPSTARYDRAKKFRLYTDIPTLKEYILIGSTKISAEVFRRDENDVWNLCSEAHDIEGSIEIACIALTLKMSDVYSRTFGLK